MGIYQTGQLQQVLHRHSFRFKKQLGQNFLTNSEVLDALVAAANLTQNSGAFEIGPGAGVVTWRLAQTAHRVLAVEKDATLEPVLRETLAGFQNVEVRFADVLKQDLAALWETFSDCADVSVIANLPYYVTTPILFHLLDAKVSYHTAVVMVQKEVADRLTAAPGGKEYGALSVTVQYRARVEKVLQVCRGAFTPAPNVDSTLVRLRPHPVPPVTVTNEEVFFALVRAAFGTRRKTVLNSLALGMGVDKLGVARALNAACIEPKRRGETLSIAEFATLSNIWESQLNGNG
ncbi:16S rRNA (adenine(1518)-N(6)/adenine(1519)-N(6))-dimethyltransferase RsmA [Alicyclobacillaceae bacterium I2511]|nr:16S rRNA (adenine(1518)-N(6)/adenine(1519)-N(6))-dimethyltransferase RsmA [Alicyclobacillaceae bacterium I2511]